MSKSLLFLAALVFLIACDKATSSGTVHRGSNRAGAGAEQTGFLSGANLIETLDQTPQTVKVNGRLVQKNTPGASCPSLKKLTTFMRATNPDEPIVVNTYDIALGDGFSLSGNFQSSNRPDAEINTLFLGPNKISLVFLPGHIGDVLSPETTTLNPADPSTFFNFPDQDKCNSVTLPDKSIIHFDATATGRKSVQFSIGSATYKYQLAANSIQVTVFQPSQTPVACGYGGRVVKTSYLFSFQKDLQNIRVGSNLYKLLFEYIPAIKDQLKGLPKGLMPAASYWIAGKDIAANKTLPADCAKPK